MARPTLSTFPLQIVMAVALVAVSARPAAPQCSQQATLTEILQDGTAVRGKGLAVYYVVKGKKRWIPDEGTLRCLGLTLADVIEVPDTVLAMMPDGPQQDCTPAPLNAAAQSLGWKKAYYSAHIDAPVYGSSQQISASIYAFPSGEVKGVYAYHNDQIVGFCGGVVIAAVDENGDALHVFTPPSGCIDGKAPGNAIRLDKPWCDEKMPSALYPKIRGIRVAAYPQEALDKGFNQPIVKTALTILGLAAKVAGIPVP